MTPVLPLSWFVVVAMALFWIGVLGILVRRNALLVLMSVEMMLNAVNLLLVAASGAFHDLSMQVNVFFIMIVAAAEVSVGLVIVTMMYKRQKSLDITHWQNLKG